MFEVTMKVKTVYVLEYTETYDEYSQREGSYKAQRKQSKNFATFNDLHTELLELKKNSNNDSFVAYRKELIDFKNPPGYRDIRNEH